MSQKEGTDPIGRLQVSESPNGNLSRLAELARQAYDRKSTKDCLDLTRAMLLIDPDNADAQWMRSSIQSDMHRDLENARAFLRQAQSKENTEKQPQPGQAAVPAGLQSDSDGKDFDPSLPSPAKPTTSRRTPGTRWLVGASVLIVLGVTVVSLPRLRTRSNYMAALLLPPGVSDRSKPIVNISAVQPDPLFVTHSAELEVASTLPPSLVSTPAPAPRAVPRVSDAPVMPAASGTLAVSSPTSVDIYKDDAYLGSVPVSLELPAGTHTLEYRHGSLRRNVTHVINSNETTRAMITFDVNVQINSKPWAEVFMDGVERQALGQTPLSGVRVPIGSVLIFENPQFQTKKYRITGNETGIQIIFP